MTSRTKIHNALKYYLLSLAFISNASNAPESAINVGKDVAVESGNNGSASKESEGSKDDQVNAQMNALEQTLNISTDLIGKVEKTATEVDEVEKDELEKLAASLPENQTENPTKNALLEMLDVRNRMQNTVAVLRKTITELRKTNKAYNSVRKEQTTLVEKFKTDTIAVITDMSHKYASLVRRMTGLALSPELRKQEHDLDIDLTNLRSYARFYNEILQAMSQKYTPLSMPNELKDTEQKLWASSKQLQQEAKEIDEKESALLVELLSSLTDPTQKDKLAELLDNHKKLLVELEDLQKNIDTVMRIHNRLSLLKQKKELMIDLQAKTEKTSKLLSELESKFETESANLQAAQASKNHVMYTSSKPEASVVKSASELVDTAQAPAAVSVAGNAASAALVVASAPTTHVVASAPGAGGSAAAVPAPALSATPVVAPASAVVASAPGAGGSAPVSASATGAALSATPVVAPASAVVASAPVLSAPAPSSATSATSAVPVVASAPAIALPAAHVASAPVLSAPAPSSATSAVPVVASAPAIALPAAHVASAPVVAPASALGTRAAKRAAAMDAVLVNFKEPPKKVMEAASTAARAALRNGVDPVAAAHAAAIKAGGVLKVAPAS